MVITPAAITDFTTYAKTSWKWSGVDRVDVTREAAYIFLASLNALIVPRRFFSSAEDFDTLVRTAREYQARFRG